MNGTETSFHDKANGAFFPIVQGIELRRVQQRFLASLLPQPGLVLVVLGTGRGNERARLRKADSGRPQRRSNYPQFVYANRFVGTWASPANGGADHCQYSRAGHITASW